MISLLPIGFTLLVLSLRLKTIRNTLHRAQKPSLEVLNQMKKEGLKLLVLGVVILIIGFVSRLFLKPLPVEQNVMFGTGSAVVFLSLPSLLQELVYQRKTTEREVFIWGWGVCIAGCLCFITYLIYRLVF